VTKAERERFRQSLLQLESRLKGDVDGLREEALHAQGGEASGSLSNAPLHLADLGTDVAEQEVLLNLLETKTDLFQQIQQALDRLDQGTYGICQKCGQSIATERLKALPFTPFCIRCAEQSPQVDVT
jgi:RNA polymerase-binding protein DksA